MEMKKLTLAAAVAAGVVLTGCGGGGGSSSSGTSTTAIEDTGSGATAVNSVAAIGSNTVTLSSTLSGSAFDAVSSTPAPPVVQARIDDESNNASRLARNLATHLNKAMGLRPTGAASFATTTYDQNDMGICTDGGTASVVYTDNTTSFEMEFTYNNCRDYGSEENGSMTVSFVYSSQTTGTMSMQMGDGDTSLESTDYTYKYYSDYLTTGYTTATYSEINSFSMTGSMEVSSTDAMDTETGDYSNTMTLNGAMSWTDSSDTETYTTETYTFNSFRSTYSYDYATYAEEVSMSGGLSYADSTVEESITFTSFELSSTMGTYPYYNETISGTIGYDSTPDSCGEGTFSFTTDTTLQWDASLGYYVAGTLTVNSDVTVDFQSNGDVTVSIEGGDTTTYTQAELAAGVCPA